MLNVPLRKLGRLQLDPVLRDLQPGPAGSGPVVTAVLPAPQSLSDRPPAWDLAWADAVREASRLGADQRTAQVLPNGGGNPYSKGTRVVVAAHGEVLLARWLRSGPAQTWVRVGPLPHLLEVAAAAARQPAYVVVLADREGTDVVVHGAGDEVPAKQFPVGERPGAQPDPDPTRPPGLAHGPRRVTDREPESGGQRNAEYIAGRMQEAADSIGAHTVIGTGDRHILEAVESHLPASLRPITAVPGARQPDGLDDHLSAQVSSALDAVTAAAVTTVGDRLSSVAGGPSPGAVRGTARVAEQLAEQQVAVLLMAADVDWDAESGASYQIGSIPTELLVDDSAAGVEVPPEDGLVWAALHQDAIVVQLPDRAGPLAGEPVAALLRRGAA